jgi:hypothetical protein
MRMLTVAILSAVSAMAQGQSFHQVQIIPLGTSPGSLSFVDPVTRHTATMAAPVNLLSDVVFRAPANVGKLGNPLTSDGVGGTTFAESLNLQSLNISDSMAVGNQISVENLLRVSNDIWLGRNFSGPHAQNVGISDSPTFYVPAVSKLALRDYTGLAGTLSFSLVASISLSPTALKHLDVLDPTGSPLFSFYQQATPVSGTARNISLVDMYVGTTGTPKDLIVTGAVTGSGAIGAQSYKIGSTTIIDSSMNATVHNLTVTGTTSGIVCSASTATSTSPAFCTNSTCTTSATVTYVSGVSVSCP